MIRYSYGKRLDDIDYGDMGLADRWYFRSTVIMLTCFDMEINRHYERADYINIYNKIYTRYSKYLYQMTKVISIEDGLSERARAEHKYFNDHSFDQDRCSFAKTDAIEYIRTNNALKIDIAILEQYLNGDAPKIVDTLDSQNVIMQQLTSSLVGIQVEVGSNVVKRSKEQYRFEKTTQSWNIQFGKLELIGVKDLVGMDYIATLLKNPGVPIGVIQIQAMLNPSCVGSSGGNQHGEFEDQDEPLPAASGNSVRSSKSISLENLKKRLKELSRERSMLDPDYDHIELEAIDNEYAKIEADIDRIQYAKDDDPEIKKNRDKVAKAIKAAIANINGLRTKEGHSCTPICDFLTQHIKTASECIYNPPTINPPDWSF